VMIPTYNASDILEKAIRSVLDQDPGAERMQIAVVDDCSPNGEAERIVERVAPGRVEFHRNPKNVGLGKNWNRCIAHARGHWLHLLHQDDVVFPGFYDRMSLASRERPDVGAAFCRHVYIDVDGVWEHLSEIERRIAGVLDGWLAKISLKQCIQCASIVVRRDVYEHLGGYRVDLSLALDWEMWVRIAAHYAVWFEPGLLACWRVHHKNESSRLQREGTDVTDVLRAIGIIRRYLPVEFRETAGSWLIHGYRDRDLNEATNLMRVGDWKAGLAKFRQACECDPSLKSSLTHFRYRKWAIKLWIRELLSPAGRRLMLKPEGFDVGTGDGRS
jgi:glycosyltransferase involved in cell wall biosynthesis